MKVNYKENENRNVYQEKGNPKQQVFSFGEDAVEVTIKESSFCRSVSDTFASETNLLI